MKLNAFKTEISKDYDMVMDNNFGEKEWLANGITIKKRFQKFYKIREDLIKEEKYLEENNVEGRKNDILNEIKQVLLDAENETVTQIVGIQDKTNHYANKDNLEKAQNENKAENPKESKKKKCTIF